MAIKVIIECNVFGCRKNLDVNETDTVDGVMHLNDWEEHPVDPHTHFCNECSKLQPELFMPNKTTDTKFLHIGICPGELLDIAIKMSQDIQEYIDEGEKGGSNMAASKELLDEFNELYAKSNQHWKNILSEDNEESLPFMLKKQAEL